MTASCKLGTRPSQQQREFSSGIFVCKYIEPHFSTECQNLFVAKELTGGKQRKAALESYGVHVKHFPSSTLIINLPGNRLRSWGQKSRYHSAPPFATNPWSAIRLRQNLRYNLLARIVDECHRSSRKRTSTCSSGTDPLRQALFLAR